MLRRAGGWAAIIAVSWPCGVWRTLEGSRLSRPPSVTARLLRYRDDLHRAETLPLVGPHFKRVRLAAEEAAEQTAHLASAGTSALTAGTGAAVGGVLDVAKLAAAGDAAGLANKTRHGSLSVAQSMLRGIADGAQLTATAGASVGAKVGLSPEVRRASSDARAADAAAAAAAQDDDRDVAKEGDEGPLNGGAAAAASSGEDAPAAVARSAPSPSSPAQLPPLRDASSGALGNKVVPLAGEP